ncbi:helix-turn-helix transcriptional regulator [Pleomorphomonas sp. NRK KF1]|uniref:helix-turn-helix domain-containing protein n=1 Tax=Pleomorphomonas sp. NRK KF1 TaxID=2943000 RepID=UPI002044085D|nr:helix-turn-helix transcriptional regulator [Pleomorphomonas sp. NRK KF1]MCM5554070.1 helix-turn-helix domain-containing protein [Pleomorphomonas sp. NRK KF1]
MAKTVYAMHMNDKIPEIVRRVESKRRETLMSQVELSRLLNVHQGHLSKILSGKAPLSKKMSLRMADLLSDWPHAVSSDPALEQELLAAVRGSRVFQEFIRVALRMHNC